MSEITYPYIRDYLKAIQPEDHELISSIREEATGHYVPIIKSEVKQLLRFLITMHKPLRILEIGTAVAYSSIIMCESMGENGHITTIERSQDMIRRAKHNIKRAGRGHQIELLEGDAGEILKTLTGSYDMIFMDAAKGQYLTFLPDCMRLLKVNGLLISDNVLQDGTVAKSRFNVPRRQRTIHQRMREYLWEINHHPQLQTSILPVADGVTLSYKLK